MHRIAWVGWFGAAFVIGASLAVAQQSAAAPAATKYKPGDRIVVIKDSELRLPSGPVAEVWPGLVLKVSVVNDKWLWVSQGKPGWIDSGDVIPLDAKAIDRLNELLVAVPNSGGCSADEPPCGASWAIWTKPSLIAPQQFARSPTRQSFSTTAAS